LPQGKAPDASRGQTQSPPKLGCHRAPSGLDFGRIDAQALALLQPIPALAKTAQRSVALAPNRSDDFPRCGLDILQSRPPTRQLADPAGSET
jgi:hypothetical protein